MPICEFKKKFIIVGTSLEKLPWRKYRIGIHSEPIRTIPIHSDVCIQANANHSEKRFVTRLMKNG